ncbi:MAG: phosphoglycerate dehydrogenase, partial [Candidatus Marinimicrobia bacterium]|nr:phosphoglycerate dehydrogenase [Candidatus Neomarinimicrobiota bacterium]
MKVLVTDPISNTGISILNDAGFDVAYEAGSSQIEKYEAAHDADGLIIRSGTQVDSKMIEYAQRLQVVGRAGVGIDNID